MKNHLTVILFTCLALPVFSQKTASLAGVVADSAGVSLPGATLILIEKKDSLLTGFGTSEDGGRFLIKKIAPGDYLLQISYVGYETLTLPVALAKDEAKDLGNLTLAPASSNLAEVQVTADHVPLRMNSDTLEYNAAAFKVQPGAVVEDLLKKLPGVEVQADGTIRAQGEQVQNVLVDGKEFFGNDPTIATKNLPAEAVDKVQVFDKASEMAEFTGIEDGRDEKTINLALKEGKKHGYFGNAMAGGGAPVATGDGNSGGNGGVNSPLGVGGDDALFEGKFNLNRFSKTTQLSAIGMGNNVNRQGFSINDYMNFMGGLSNFMDSPSGGGGGGGGRMRISFDLGESGLPIGANLNNGFTTTWAGGLNLNREFGKKTKLSASYFFNRLKNDIERTATAENLLGDQLFRTEEDEKRLSQNDNHRLNLTLRHELDSFQNLIFRTRMGFNDAQITSESSELTREPDGGAKNFAFRDYHSTGESLDLSSNLTYRRRFKRKGRAFVADLSFGKNAIERQGNLYSLNQYFFTGQAAADTVRQRQTYDDNAMNYGATISFTEPVGKREYLEFQASRQNYDNDTRKDFYDIPTGGGEQFNPALSNQFDRGYRYDRGGVNLMVNRQKWNLTAGSALQNSKLTGRILGEEETLDRHFTRLLPSLFFHFEPGMGRNFDLDYTTDFQEPSLEQLLPIVDNSDPLDTYQGNPLLRPEYSHNLNLHFMRFDQFTFTSFFATLNGRYTKNRITNASTIDSLFRRNTMPVNVANDVNLGGYLNFQTPLKFIKSNLKMTWNTNWNRGILFVNDVENETDRLTNSLELSLENRKKENFDGQIGARLTHSKTAYSVSEALDQTYLNKLFFADVKVFPGKKWELATSLDYKIYSAETFGNEQTIPIWRASLTRYLLKNNRGQLKLAAYDLLNKNLGVNRSSQLNYVEEERIRSLGRYVMLTFAYSISGFDKPSGGIEIQMNEERE